MDAFEKKYFNIEEFYPGLNKKNPLLYVQTDWQLNKSCFKESLLSLDDFTEQQVFFNYCDLEMIRWRSD